MDIPKIPVTTVAITVNFLDFFSNFITFTILSFTSPWENPSGETNLWVVAKSSSACAYCCFSVSSFSVFNFFRAISSADSSISFPERAKASHTKGLNQWIARIRKAIPLEIWSTLWIWAFSCAKMKGVTFSSKSEGR